MAYGLRYESNWTNELQQTVRIELLKNAYSGDADPFITQSCEVSASSDEGTIIAHEAAFVIWADNDTEITWETFLAGSYDEWKVRIMLDTQPVFEGFLTPEEGSSPFLPKPYDIKLRAANGLKLLKDVPFTGIAGATIKGNYDLSYYLCAALEKTLLGLPVRVYGSWYNPDMDDRSDDIAATFWNQVKMDNRSLLKDVTTYLTCYDVLVMLLGIYSRVFYHNGRWTVFLLNEHQVVSEGIFYTDLNPDATVIGGAEDTSGYASVGKAEAIYPINEDGLISSSFPIKFARTNFQYKVWPEIPRNNKFSRGTLIGTGIDTDGNPYEDYTIDDWDANMVDITATPPNFDFDPVEGDLFVRRTFNIYGVELRREIFFETPTTASPGGGYVKWLRCGQIPVNRGDKIKISASLKFDNDFSGAGDTFSIIGRVYIIPDAGSVYYAMDNNKGGVETNVGKWIEENGTPPNFISVDIPEDSDSREYKSVTIESDAIPASGVLYIALQHVNDGTNAGGNKWFTGFELEYIPYTAGGYVPISGDYWQHTQNANQLDKDEGDITVSDTIIRVLQGCLLNPDGTATTPNWYRQGITESRHFKELVNLTRYNLGYRRFYRIEGTFTGLLYSPVNDSLAYEPIGFHKNYLFADLSTPRQFILVAPLQMNLATGDIKATFEEVLNPDQPTEDGLQNADSREFNYIFSKQ